MIDNYFNERKKNTVVNDSNTVKLIPLGGMGDVTKNMYLYETENEILVVDCGIGFPSVGILGVDIVIPDIKYLLDRKSKLKAFLITHGHDDHIAALEYILPQIGGQIPIYATKLVIGFIKNKLLENDSTRYATFNEVNPEGDRFNIGSFGIDAFRVNHSIPDAVGYVINAGKSQIVHVSDFKFDLTPVDNKFFDIKKLIKAVNGKPSLLLSDCLGSLHEGFSKTEKTIEDNFEEIIKDAKGQVIITTNSSNISRMQQAADASIRHGRKIVMSGRSIDSNTRIAMELGYLNIDKKNLVKMDQAKNFPDESLTYMVAGSYGQKGSALWRISDGTHKNIKLAKDCTVIFSSDPNPPGVKNSVDAVISRLSDAGADVHFYEIQEGLHVSGHGSSGDILLLARIVDPLNFVPIGGTFAHMKGYTHLMMKAGYNKEQVFELRNGQSLVLNGNKATIGDSFPVKDIFVDGLGIGDVGAQILGEREILSQSGIVVLSISNSGGIESVTVETRGFVFVKESSKLLNEIKSTSESILKQTAKRALPERKKALDEGISKYVLLKTERAPLILPVFI